MRIGGNPALKYLRKCTIAVRKREVDRWNIFLRHQFVKLLFMFSHPLSIDMTRAYFYATCTDIRQTQSQAAIGIKKVWCVPLVPISGLKSHPGLLVCLPTYPNPGIEKKFCSVLRDKMIHTYTRYSKPTKWQNDMLAEEEEKPRCLLIVCMLSFSSSFI